MLENEKIWILQNILSNVEGHNSAKLLRESLFKVIDGLTPLITASGAGLYQGKISPNSSIPSGISQSVFAVTEPGTYTNFGNVNLPANHFGFIFWDGNQFSISTAEIPMQDLTPINNRVTAIESGNTQFQNNVNQRIDDLETEQQYFIDNFAVEVDQEFDENSDNAIANKEVSKLAGALEGFVGSSIIDLSGSTGDKKVYNKDLSIAASNDLNNTSIFKYPLNSGVTEIYLKFQIPYTTTANVNLYSCITFEKEDGTLVDYLGWTTATNKPLFNSTINVLDKGYKSITITWNHKDGKKLEFIIRQKIENKKVKDYIDAQNLHFITERNSLDSEIIDLNLSSDFNLTVNGSKKISIIPKINGVDNFLFNLKINYLFGLINFPDSVRFINNEMPLLEPNNTYIIVFQTYDYGNTWFASIIGAYPFINKLTYYNNFSTAGVLTDFSSSNSNSFSVEKDYVKINGSVTGNSIAYIDIGVNEYTVSGIFSLQNIASKIVYKYVDSKNFSVFGYNNIANKVNIITVINENIKEDLSYNIANMNDNDSFKVQVSSTNNKFYVNDVLIVSSTSILPLFSNVTKIGLIGTNIADKIYVKNLIISTNE